MKQSYVTMYRIKSNFKLKIHYHDQFHGFFKLVVFANSSWWNWNFQGLYTMIHHKQILQKRKQRTDINWSWIMTSMNPTMPFNIKSPNKIWGFFSTLKLWSQQRGGSPDLILCLKLEVWQLNQLSSVAGNFLSWVEEKTPPLLKIWCWKSCTGKRVKTMNFYPWRYKDRNGARLSNGRDGCICQKSLIKSTYTKICDSQLHGHSWPFYA